METSFWQRGLNIWNEFPLKLNSAPIGTCSSIKPMNSFFLRPTWTIFLSIATKESYPIVCRTRGLTKGLDGPWIKSVVADTTDTSNVHSSWFSRHLLGLHFFFFPTSFEVSCGHVTGFGKDTTDTSNVHNSWFSRHLLGLHFLWFFFLLPLKLAVAMWLALANEMWSEKLISPPGRSFRSKCVISTYPFPALPIMETSRRSLIHPRSMRQREAHVPTNQWWTCCPSEGDKQTRATFFYSTDTLGSFVTAV